MDEKVLSAQLLSDPVEVGRDPSPERLEITTEKVVTETRTYEKEFLLRQKAQIEQDKIDYLAARDLELEQIDALLAQFETLKGTPIEIIKEKI